ncbi:hypothetical protein O3P69_019094 [Scylla paramamosain]|uniref:Uncharacterized protein n=1 Tax=Scylla paramamosain TaxID=85552 RepID=A0AAW0S9C6_SCYPA
MVGAEVMRARQVKKTRVCSTPPLGHLLQPRRITDLQIGKFCINFTESLAVFVQCSVVPSVRAVLCGVGSNVGRRHYQRVGFGWAYHGGQRDTGSSRYTVTARRV